MAESIKLTINGHPVSVAADGTMPLLSVLREELNLEKQPVWLEVHNDRINVMNKSVYEERLQQALSNNAADLEALEIAGLK